MKRETWISILKWTAWVLSSVVALVLLLVAAIYIPAIQDPIIDKVLEKVNSGGELNISASRIRLKFPLRVEVDSFTMKQKTDTMVTLGSLRASASVMPLLSGTVDIPYLSARDAVYKAGNRDSAIQIDVKAGTLDVWDAAVRLSSMDIDLGKADLDKADIRLFIRNDSTEKARSDTVSAATAMKINAKDITLADIDFIIAMEGMADTVSAHLGNAILDRGTMDLGKCDIHAVAVSLDSVSARYIYPKVTSAPATAAVSDTVQASSQPWTIGIDRIRLDHADATYAASGAVPVPGLDMDYIQVSDITIEVDSFYNRATEIRVPLRRLSATERSGLKLFADGVFSMDSAAMKASDFSISTAFSHLRLDAMMGMGDIASDPSLPIAVKADASISPMDIKTAFPALSPVIDRLPPYTDLLLEADVSGTASDIDIRNLKAEMPRCIVVKGSGRVENPMDINRISGNVALSGRIINGTAVKQSVIDAKMGKLINIPTLSLNGNARMNRGEITADIEAVTDSGTIALNALWNNRKELYDGTLSFSHFPIEAFLPTAGIRDLSADASVCGTGYNPMAPGFDADADINLKSVIVNSHRLSGITLNAGLHDGYAKARIVSSNPEARFDITADGNVASLPYSANISGDISGLDLYALGLAADKADIATQFKGKADINPSSGLINAEVDIASLKAVLKPAVDVDETGMRLTFHTDSAATSATLTNHDLKAEFSSPMPLDSILARMTPVTDSINSYMRDYSIRIDGLASALPHFTLKATAGTDNIIHDFLKPMNMDFKRLSLTAGNDGLLALDGKIIQLTSGKARLDTVSLDMKQMGKYLTYRASVDNAPGTMDAFANVNAGGYISGSKLGIQIDQRNISGKTGYKLGATASIADSVLTVNLVPYQPIIGYKQWEVNHDNFISLNIPHKHIDADLQMKSTESSLRLYTEHIDSVAGQEDIILNLTDVKIADWIAINPFAPSVKGNLSADLRVRQDEEKMITGDGTISLDNFYYGKQRVGSFEIGADITTNARGYLTAKLDLMIDSVKTITAYGSLNDTTRSEPFLLDFKMIKFPLSVVNPFLPQGTVKLAGTLNGTMDITGSTTEPVFNGYLDFDSTSMLVSILGTDFRFSEEKIPVDSNVVSFHDFSIFGVNSNPLTIDGTVDMRSLINPRIDLSMKAREMQIVGTTRPRRGADIYGKAFIDADARVKGDMDMLNADAALTVLAGTNVTYVMTDAQTALQSRSTEDMVKFVNFADTTSIAATDTVVSTAGLMNLNAVLTIDPGSIFNVDLSADGKNKVQIKGNGTLDYSMNMMDDSQLSGRFNITGGFVRYTPPLMSEKLFNFQEGSFVSFNGNMMNPVLNVHAVDNLKANVTQTGQNSRLITFNIGLGVTGSLENMNIAFDLSTRDDITIQNELQSMSAEQRANQAMNLLLYNVYTGPGTKANSNLGANPLYSFLESQLNSWAANTIKGVDLSFGINQYDKTQNGATSTTTSYSYKVSKSLFNDRFKIVVGGNYSDDADPDQNVAESLVNDISFEYMLNKNGTMVVRIFRHTGYESILEGEITQTGVGFVYKRKIQRLSDMFKPFNKLPLPALPQQGAILTPVKKPAENDDKEH